MYALGGIHAKFYKITFDRTASNVVRGMGKEPPERLGRTLLQSSLTFKISNNLTPDVQNRLEQLIKAYKRNPNVLTNAVTR